MTRLAPVGFLAAALWVGGCAMEAPPPPPPSPPWRTLVIGDAREPVELPAPREGELIVAGAGSGFDRRGDHLQFVAQAFPAGDVEIVARLAEFRGGARSRAGLMIRADDDPTAPTAAIMLDWQDAGPDRHALRWLGRAEPDGPLARAGIFLAGSYPLWLKLTRVGNYFAAYKSADGRLWLPLGNTSGGLFPHAGPLSVGVFVAGGRGEATATARFDNLSVGPPRLAFRTSWVGNTFGSRPDDAHVSNGLSAMWVAPDGTVYTSAYWDEGGRPVASYRDGRVGRRVPVGTTRAAEGGITGDARYLFVAWEDRLVRLTPAAANFAPRPVRLSVSLLDTNTQYSVVGGLASDGRELFVADTRADLIRVAPVEPAGDPEQAVELVERAFAFERPGPMAVDGRGELWIVQRGRDHPLRHVPHGVHRAAIKCYRPDGTFTGRQITDVVNPRALAYDAARDELLVAENGPDFNVRIYRGLDTAPALARTFGQAGGIYSGATPGRVDDPAAGGHARFAGLAGVGVDAAGNLYVGGGLSGTDLRMFRPDGSLGWMLNSHVFCNTYDVDPVSDGADIYTTYNHLRLDLTQTAPGAEQRYFAYNWDVRRFGEPWRVGGSQAIVRRLGRDQRLVMFTSGQGHVGDIHIFRYDGHLAIPAGGTRQDGAVFWVDANGNGLEEAGETVKMAAPMSWVTGLCVDANGDIWAANATTAGCFMRRFSFLGFNEHGVPRYDTYEDLRFPEEGGTVNAWGMVCRLDYDAARDILIAFYPAEPRSGDQNSSSCRYYLARYDRWSKGNRQPTWKIRAPTPYTEPHLFMYEVDVFPHNGYMGLHMAGDYVFFAYLFGEVHVFDARTGQLVQIFSPGPEVSGLGAWEDAAMGVRAFRRRNGEYLIFVENSGWGGKNHLYRWKP